MAYVVNPKSTPELYVYGVVRTLAWNDLTQREDLEVEYWEERRIWTCITNTREAREALYRAVREMPETPDEIETADVRLDLYRLHRDRRAERKEKGVENAHYIREIRYVNRLIARRPDYGEEVELGEGVALLSGGLPTERRMTGAAGGRPDLNPFEGTTVLVEDVPVDLIHEDDPYISAHSGLTLKEEKIVRMYNSLDDDRKGAVDEWLERSSFEPPSTKVGLEMLEADEAAA